MIKTAQEAYVAGRQAAMEKLADPTAEMESLDQSMLDYYTNKDNRLAINSAYQAALGLGANALGAGYSDNPDASMSVGGALAPVFYGNVGNLAGYGIGRGLLAYSDNPNAESAARVANRVGGLGTAFGLYRALYKPDED